MIQVTFHMTRIDWIEESILNNLTDYNELQNQEELKNEIEFLRFYFELLNKNDKTFPYNSLKEFHQFEKKINNWFSDLWVTSNINEDGNIDVYIEEE